MLGTSGASRGKARLRMIWSFEPCPAQCDLDWDLLAALSERNISFAFNHSDSKIHVHLWKLYEHAIATNGDYDFVVMFLLFDGLMHEELHATFSEIGETDIESYRAEEDMIKSMRKTGDWSVEV